MSASPGGQRRTGLRLSTSSVTPVVAALVFLLLMLMPLALVANGAANGWLATLPLLGYLLLVLVTWGVVAGVRREPGSWLERRGVRRAVVAAIAADCVGLIATSLPGLQVGSVPLLLLSFLVLLNIALGNATERMATAPDGSVDERQEALRNRAHRLAYPALAAVVGAILIADVVSTPSREWAEHVLGSGGLFVFLELLFVLPGMVLAFIEPAPPPPEPDAPARPRAANVHARVAVALVVMVFALPVLASVGVAVLPLRISSGVSPSMPPPICSGCSASSTTAGQPPNLTTCHSFDGQVVVGWGAYAGLEYSGQACWTEQSTSQTIPGWCGMGDQAFVAVTNVDCSSTSAGGTVTFTTRATLSPDLLPFLRRQVTVRVTIDRNGRLEIHT
jgi:Na+-transporting methylmalonyl-CoA/oxaloacetate decarboxylase gamma subunit